MKNYIPTDFYSASKNTIYTTKKHCLTTEGSAIEFDPNKIDLSTHTLIDGQFVLDDSKQLAIVNTDLIKAKYDSMVSDVYAEMKVVFGTTNDASAAAYASTYEAMLSRPLNYVDAALGLNTEEEVTIYAATKINAADAYGVYRMKRIAQYQAEKAAILSGE